MALKYDVGDMLGQGGFGSVYVATDEHGNEFAIKYFSQNQPLQAEILANVKKRFVKEVRIQKSISHSNIVPIIEAFEGDDLAYVMPKATCSLADEIEADKSEVAVRYMHIISDIAAALTHLHSMQIYHRDLKPQNILRFDEPDGSIQYKISDFGLISLKETNLSNLTSTGMRKGSDAYTAPEITQKLSTALAQTDVYSLACILHDIVDDGIRVPCGAIKSETSFSDIFAVATRTDPTGRFPTAKAFVDAVAAVAFSTDTPTVPEVKDIAVNLGTAAEDDADFWSGLLDALAGGKQDAKNYIFARLTDGSLQNAIQVSGEIGQQIYASYCDWIISRRDFPFEYCDVLCNRVLDCFEIVDFERRFKGCYALLCLGTSHNRWFVERCFMDALGPEIEDAFAARAAIEFRVLDKSICGKIRHLKESIDVDIEELHPEISKAIGEICV